MGYNINKLIDIFQNEDGYVEKRKNCPKINLYEKVGKYAGADNWTKYWKDMADIGLSNYQGSYYCIATLFWGMIKAFGLEAAQKLCLQKFMINCQVTYDLFKKAGQTYTTPKVGDIVVFWNGNRFHHAEFVVYVKGDVVKTFGANTTAVTSVTVYNGGGCRYNKIYSLKSMQSGGHKFLRPKYGNQFEEKWVLVDDDSWKYQLSDGSFVTNTWKQIKNVWYYFDKNSYMVKGWLYKDSQWYYLSDSGAMDKSWKLIDNKWVYFNEDGSLRKGWLQHGADWYYLTEEDGTMATGLMQINRMWYYFRDSGEMIFDTWYQVNDNWYYFSSTGAAYVNEWKQDIDGSYYYLGSDGKMVMNCYVKDKIFNIYYYVGKDGIWNGKEVNYVPIGSIVCK